MDEVEISLENIQKSSNQRNSSIKIIMVMKGSLDVKLNQEVYHLTADDIIVINRNSLHSLQGNQKNVVLKLELGEAYLQQECIDLLDYDIKCNSILMEQEKKSAYFEIKRYMMQMLIMNVNKHVGYKLELKKGLFSLLTYLFRYFRECREEQDEKNVGYVAILEAQNYIRKNYQRNISLETVAKKVYLSPQYFSKSFKRVTGVGFLNYLTDIRLEHSLMDLIQTEDTILKIAITQGFSNAKAYSTAFKHKYGVLPSTYRKEHREVNKTEEYEDIISKFDIDLMDTELDFFKYIRNDESDYIRDGITVLTTNVAELEENLFIEPSKIVIIDDLAMVLQTESYEQLKYIQNRLNFQYIYFQISEEILLLWFEQWETFGYYQLFSLINRLYELNLIPIFHVDYVLVKKCYASRGGAGVFIQSIRLMLSRGYDDFKLKCFMQRFRFELYCSDSDSVEGFGEFFSDFYLEFKNMLSGKNIGLLALTDVTNSSKKKLSELLRVLSKKQIMPEFFSFYACPNQEVTMDDSFKDYYRNMLLEMRATIEQNYSFDSDIDIFMMKWNTLVGKSAAEVTSFFRPALILDAILSVIPEVNGVGFYLNTSEMLKKLYQPENVNMALFLHNRIKRPIYFVTEVLNRMGNKVILQEDHLWVTAIDSNELMVMAYYPCYVNPSLSLDYAYINEFNQQRSLKITGLNEGTYQIKIYEYDRANISVFHILEGMGSPNFLNSEEIEYLEGAIAPKTRIMNEKISNEYLLRMTLSFNGMYVARIRRINTGVKQE